MDKLRAIIFSNAKILRAYVAYVLAVFVKTRVVFVRNNVLIDVPIFQRFAETLINRVKSGPGDLRCNIYIYRKNGTLQNKKESRIFNLQSYVKV